MCGVSISRAWLKHSSNLQALNIGASAPRDAINISKVLEILNRHVDKLDPLRAVEEIPSEVSLKKLERFLTRLLETQHVYLSKVSGGSISMQSLVSFRRAM